MRRLEEYVAYAETCRALAASAKDLHRKEELLALAARWALFVEERERLLQSRKRLAELP